MNMISKTWRSVLRLWNDRPGQDMIEYALTAGFIAVASSAFFPPAIAPAISTIFSKVVEMMPDVG